MLHKEIGGHDFAQADSHVYCGKPYISGHAVQDATYAAVIVRHACQLPVGAVKGIGPNEQQHSYDVDAQIGEIESYAGADAQKYGCDGDGVGGDAEAPSQTSPGVAYGSVKSQVYMFFCVRAFERGAIC